MEFNQAILRLKCVLRVPLKHLHVAHIECLFEYYLPLRKPHLGDATGTTSRRAATRMRSSYVTTRLRLPPYRRAVARWIASSARKVGGGSSPARLSTRSFTRIRSIFIMT